MTKGVVYILTNPCMQGWVKIGHTDDIKGRLSSLNSSDGIPLCFRAYATLSAENPRDIEQQIHGLIDTIDSSLRSIEKLENGRERKREFYQMSPEKAYMVFEKVSAMLNISDNLKLNTPTEQEQAEEQVVYGRCKDTTFEMLGIPQGAELTFFKDSSIKCAVVDNISTVLYQDKEWSITGLAKKLLGYTGSGTRFFIYEDETLWDRRMRLENENCE
jgi:hypothetical protein